MQLNRAKVVASATGWLTLYGWVGEVRIRWSLGTKKSGEAQNRADWIVRCVSEGTESSLWPNLKDVLPRRTFDLLSELVGYKPVAVAAKVEPRWFDLRQSYITALDIKILEGRFTESSKRNYLQSIKAFDAFVATRGLSKLADFRDDITALTPICIAGGRWGIGGSKLFQTNIDLSGRGGRRGTRGPLSPFVLSRCSVRKQGFIEPCLPSERKPERHGFIVVLPD